MDDPKSQTTEIEAGEPRSIAQAVESLLENAAEALTRATDCDDADWQKFHLGTAAACKELALQLKPLVSIQARIDEKAVMIRRRFQLGPQPKREVRTHEPDAREPEDAVTAPETIAASSDLSPPPGGHDHDVDDLEAFKAEVDAVFASSRTAPASTWHSHPPSFSFIFSSDPASPDATAPLCPFQDPWHPCLKGQYPADALPDHSRLIAPPLRDFRFAACPSAIHYAALHAGGEHAPESR
jgi:hypothetical protein